MDAAQPAFSQESRTSSHSHEISHKTRRSAALLVHQSRGRVAQIVFMAAAAWIHLSVCHDHDVQRPFQRSESRYHKLYLKSLPSGHGKAYLTETNQSSGLKSVFDLPHEMDKLKSKTGCLTCVARRKKCDEAVPTCGHCTRLNITCVRRALARDRALVLISSTNLKARKNSPPRTPITNGYPPFGSDFERHLAIESPGALAALVSCMAGPGFRDVVLFGTFCAESRLVRQALVAFSAYSRAPQYHDSYKLSLRSYQLCITDMKQTRSYEDEDAAGQDRVLTAIMFLGLLEGLKIGDSSNAVAHFEMCRKLLTARLSQPGVLHNAALVKLYRVVAECIMYNLAALSPFHVGIDHVVTDWGSSFDCLFPDGDHALSPFLGGFHDVYRLMLRLNIHLRRTSSMTSAMSTVQRLQTLEALWRELHALEVKVPASYRRVEGAASTRLYKAKHMISVLALGIHLVKISNPTIASSDVVIRRYLQKAIAIMTYQDIREPGNPALRWPLTILACAATGEEDFRFVVGKMKELDSILDPSNCGKLQSAYRFLQKYRQGHVDLQTHHGSWTAHDQLDFLLEPQFLDDTGTAQSTREGVFPKLTWRSSARKPCSEQAEQSWWQM